MEIEKVVNEIIYEVVKKHGITIEMITPEKLIIEDLSADSLDVIEMMLAFQEKFDVFINEEDISEIRSIQDIYSYAKDRLNNE